MAPDSGTVSSARRLSRALSRRGLTLVEMLVAMAVSLIMVYGMVLAFERIGNEISDGRAMIEMSNLTRNVANRLRQDLAGVTVPVRPWTSAEPPQGYFEYVEGEATDNPNESRRSFGSIPAFDLLGDIDDVLMFTARDLNDQFIGNVPQLGPGGAFVDNMLASELAEVVWFSRWLDANGDNIVGEQEVTLHRRALLIRPDLANRVDASGTILDDNGAQITSLADPRIKRVSRFALSLFGGPGTTTFRWWSIPGEMVALRDAIEFFHQNCDVSVRWQVALRNSNSEIAVLPVPNSLSDLGDRSNRFCHFPICVTDPGSGNVACLPQLVANGSAWPAAAPLPVYPYEVVSATHYDSPSWNVGARFAPFTTPSLTRCLLGWQSATSDTTGPRTGQDVMMHNLLAFDVRAYDVTAPVLADEAAPANVSRALSPGDPGYPAAVVAGAPVVGVGAYVDLGFAARTLPPGTVASQFSGPPLWGNFLSSFTPGPPWFLTYTAPMPAPFAGRPRTYTQFTYDPLTLKYESDQALPRIVGVSAGVQSALANQDGDASVDEMTNGWDDDGNLAVDDDGEREAPSPYGDPLRGVRITIRFTETETRQVRQTSVTKNFVPD